MCLVKMISVFIFFALLNGIIGTETSEGDSNDTKTPDAIAENLGIKSVLDNLFSPTSVTSTAAPQFLSARLPLTNFLDFVTYAEKIGLLIAEIEALIEVVGPEEASNVLRYVNTMLRLYGGANSTIGITILNGLVHMLGGKLLELEANPKASKTALLSHSLLKGGTADWHSESLPALFGTSIFGGNRLDGVHASQVNHNNKYVYFRTNKAAGNLLGKVLVALASRSKNVLDKSENPQITVIYPRVAGTGGETSTISNPYNIYSRFYGRNVVKETTLDPSYARYNYHTPTTF